MNNRILMVVASATLLALTSGCSGMRNFLFGRGAGCGLCSSVRPLSNLNPLNRAQVPAPPTRYGPALIAPGAIAGPGCGQEAVCGREAACGIEAGCGHEVISGSCPCGNSHSYGPAVSNYPPSIGTPAVSDPYLSGNVISGGEVIGGEIIGGEIIGSGQVIEGQIIGGYPSSGTVIGGSYPAQGTVLPDSWVPRGGSYGAYKVDENGDRIIHEDPLPPGAISAN